MPGDLEAHAPEQPWRGRDLPVAERLQTFDDGMTSHGRLPWRPVDCAAVAISEIQCWLTPGGGNGRCGALASSSESSIAGFGSTCRIVNWPTEI